MDGVIYHGNRLLPGVREFVDWLQREKEGLSVFNQQQRKDPAGAASQALPDGIGH